MVIDRYCGDNDILGDTTEVKYVSSLGGTCAIQVLGLDQEIDWVGKIHSADY